MLSNGNSYGTANATGGNCANDLSPALVTPTPWWFMPVTVWHPRAGK